MEPAAQGTLPSPTIIGRRPLSPAEWSGIAALLLYLLMWPFDPHLAMLPATGFVLACLVMPFLPTSSFFLPVISRGKTLQPEIGLTFDDGPDPASTPFLLDLLDRYATAATFFVNGDRAQRHPDLIREIVARGHSIGNHSYSHDDFIMFRSVGRLISEITRTQQVLAELGVTPRLFRPPVGITTSRYADALWRTGLTAVNFSRRGRDMGNRRIQGLSRRIVRGLRPGDIILLHDVPPKNGAVLQSLLTEVEAMLRDIREKGFAVVPLAKLIDRPVMEVDNKPSVEKHAVDIESGDGESGEAVSRTVTTIGDHITIRK